MPFAAFAHEAPQAEATTTKSIAEIKKEEKRQEISKQLTDTINICAALINKIQDLENRVLDRVAILASNGSISKELQDKIDAKQKSLDDVLANANNRVENNLPKLSDAILNATKTAKPVKDFKAEVNKIKADLINSHKLVVELIGLVKTETATTTSDEATTTPEQE